MTVRVRIFSSGNVKMEGQLDAEFREGEEAFMSDSKVESDSESIEDDSVPDTSVAAALPRPPVDEEVSAYLARGCGCKKNDGRPCSAAFSGREVTAYRLDIAELKRCELDMALLAQLHAGMNADDLLTNTRGSSRPQVRQRVTFTYMFKGKRICREMFAFLHNISRTRLYNAAEHLMANLEYTVTEEECQNMHVNMMMHVVLLTLSRTMPMCMMFLYLGGSLSIRTIG